MVIFHVLIDVARGNVVHTSGVLWGDYAVTGRRRRENSDKLIQMLFLINECLVAAAVGACDVSDAPISVFCRNVYNETSQ